MTEIKGAGGKPEQPRQLQTPESTLRTNTIVSSLEIVSEGEVVGLENGWKDVEFNSVPVQNQDGSFNFEGVEGDFTVGLPVQPALKGFEETYSTYYLGLDVNNGTPITKELYGSSIDAAIITLFFPEGLSDVDTTTGEVKGNSVQVRIYTKQLLPSNLPETLVIDREIKGTGLTSYQTDFRVEAPDNSTKWQFRVERVSGDDTNAFEKSKFSIDRWVEVRKDDPPLTYPNAALAGLHIPADQVGNQVPTRGYRLKGIICEVPDNLDTETRVFTGAWSGGFKLAWTDDPAWILRELCVNDTFGIGTFAGNPIKVNKWDLYDCSVHNSEIVNSDDGESNHRYSCNVVIAKQSSPWDIIQSIASCMMSVATTNGHGEVTVIQDRPTPVSRILVNSSVLGGEFVYSSKGLDELVTACNVTFNDKEDRYLPKTISEPLEGDDFWNAGIERYGYRPADVAAYACVTEGQARRFGKFLIYSSLYEKDKVSFSMGVNIVGLQVGSVVGILDNDYATTDNTTFLSGRIVSISGNSVTLDRQVDLTESGFEIHIQDLDYSGILERQTNTTGTTNQITLTSSVPVGDYEGHEFYCLKTGVIEPRYFKITNISEQDTGVYSVLATIYDDQKWDIIEEGAVPKISPKIVKYAVPKVTGLQVTEDHRNDDILETNIMRLVWDFDPKHLEFEVEISRNAGATTKYNTSERFLEFENIPSGIYNISIRAVGLTNVLSPRTTLVFDFGTGDSLVHAPIDLQVANTGGSTIFSSESPTFEWFNNPSNPAGALKDYRVSLYTTDNILKKVYDIPYIRQKASPLYKGGKQTYPREAIIGDFESAVRGFRIDVQARDVFGRLSPATSIVATNPAPGLPSAGSSITGVGRDITITLGSTNGVKDWHELIVAMSPNSGFSPTASTWTYRTPAQGATQGITVRAKDEGTFYAKFAISDNYNDTDLNWTPQYTVVIADDTAILVFPTPSAPTGLAVSQISTINSSGEVVITSTLSWDAVTDRTSTYTIAWKNLTDGETEFNYSDTSETSIQIPVWLADKNLTVKVRANFGDRFSPWTPDYNFSTIGDNTAPTPPNNLTSTQGIDLVTLTWDYPPEADYAHTNIYWSSTNDRGTSTRVASVKGDSYTFPGLTPGLIGYFWGTSVDTSGNESEYFPNTTTGIVGTTSGVTFDVPPDPTNLSISSQTTINVTGETVVVSTLSWDGVTPSTGYTLRWKDLTSGDTEFSSYQTTHTSVQIPVWLANHDLSIEVRTENVLESSNWVGILYTTTAVIPTPATPSGLTSTQGVDIVTLNWNPSGDANYKITEIYWSATNDVGDSILVDSIAGTSYTFPELTPGLVGYFWIRHVNTAGIKSAYYPTTTQGIQGSTSGVDYADLLGTKPPNNATVGAPAGTYVGTILAEDLEDDLTNVITDFNATNNQNYSSIVDPTVGATPISHTVNQDGTCDLIFEWSWAGNNQDIDGFGVYYVSRITSASYNFGFDPSIEFIAQVPAEARRFTLFGTPVDKHYTLGVRAFRRVTAKSPEAPEGVMASALKQTSNSTQDPYLPEDHVAIGGINVDNLNNWGHLVDTPPDEELLNSHVSTNNNLLHTLSSPNWVYTKANVVGGEGLDGRFVEMTLTTLDKKMEMSGLSLDSGSYTISFTIEISNAVSPTVYAGLQPATLPEFTFVPPVGRSKQVFNFTSSHIDMYNCSFRIFIPGYYAGTIRIFNVKLEAGNLATPPAPNYLDIVSLNNRLSSANLTGFMEANTITATQIFVSSLSALSADLGTVTAGSLDTSGYIRAEGLVTSAEGDSSITGNTSYQRNNGIIGYSNTSLGSGVIGYNDGSGVGIKGISINGFGGYFTSISGEALRVFGTSTFTGQITVQDYIDFVGFTHYQLLRRIDGDVGIATTSSNEINMSSTVTDTEVYCSGANVTIRSTASDRSLKENIKEEELGIDFINALNPVTFTFKEKQNNFPKEMTRHGLIAQDLLELLGGHAGDDAMVNRRDSDGKLYINYPSLIAPLIKAVQELSDENAQIRQQLNNLLKRGNK